MRELPSGRTDLIDSVRDAIARGRYESDEKLSVAIDRLIDDLEE